VSCVLIDAHRVLNALARPAAAMTAPTYRGGGSGPANGLIGATVRTIVQGHLPDGMKLWS
jgi:hypothetical protein